MIAARPVHIAMNRDNILRIKRLAKSNVITAGYVFTLMLILFLVGSQLTSAAFQSSVEQSTPAQSHFKFNNVRSGRALKYQGRVEVSFSDFQAEDSISVRRSIENYQSHEAASAELSKLISHAEKVVTKNIKSDQNHHEVGPRVELVNVGPEKDSIETVVAWVDGKRLFKLTSKSRAHVLDFEAQDYPSVLPSPH
jgi:hypothetical protein